MITDGGARRRGIIVGTQLNGNPDYLGPAIVFSLVDLILVLLLSVEIGRRAAPADPVVQRSTKAARQTVTG